MTKLHWTMALGLAAMLSASTFAAPLPTDIFYTIDTNPEEVGGGDVDAGSWTSYYEIFPTAIAATDDHVYFSSVGSYQDNGLFRVTRAEGRTERELKYFPFTSTADTSIVDMDYNPADGMLYLADTQFGSISISKVAVADFVDPVSVVTKTEIVGDAYFTGSSSRPSFIAVIGDRVYWSSFVGTGDGFYSSKLDGTDVKQELTTITSNGVRGLDSDGTYLYWVDTNDDAIYKALLSGDGSDATMIVDVDTIQIDPTPTPNDLVYYKGWVYWTEQGDEDGVYGAKIDGSMAQKFEATDERAIGITAIPEPATMALMGLGGLLIAGRRRRA